MPQITLTNAISDIFIKVVASAAILLLSAGVKFIYDISNSIKEIDSSLAVVVVQVKEHQRRLDIHESLLLKQRREIIEIRSDENGRNRRD